LPPVLLSRRADIVNRSVRIHGLPSGIEDGLLQQALEKVSEGVRRVEVFAGTGEATVELDTSARAGMLLLVKDFELQGHRIVFSESTAPPRESKILRSQLASLTASTSSTQGESVLQDAFLPRAALGRSRPRAGLGHKKKLGLGLSNEPMNFDIGDSGTESQQSNVVLKPHGGMNQDAFRKMLG